MYFSSGTKWKSISSLTMRSPPSSSPFSNVRLQWNVLQGFGLSWSISLSMLDRIFWPVDGPACRLRCWRRTSYGLLSIGWEKRGTCRSYGGCSLWYQFVSVNSSFCSAWAKDLLIFIISSPSWLASNKSKFLSCKFIVMEIENFVSPNGLDQMLFTSGSTLLVLSKWQWTSHVITRSAQPFHRLRKINKNLSFYCSRDYDRASCQDGGCS